MFKKPNMEAINSATQIMERVINTFDDSKREGLIDTPSRYIKFLNEFLTTGKDFKFTKFSSEGMDEMITVSNIKFYSLCEHHLAPFFGTATIAYIPNGTILGLSKIPRCLDYYARAFQNQERITSQVAERLYNESNAKGVAVSLRAEHLCMAMRGIKKDNAMTTTTKLIGLFKTDIAARNEFLNILPK